MNLFPSPGLFAAFVAASVLLALTPGPDMALYLARTFGGGRSHGFAALVGAMSGVIVHTFAAALGLSALIAASARAYDAVKIVGALYLIYLAWGALRRGAAPKLEAGGGAAGTLGGAYMAGLLINLTNPKVIHDLSGIPILGSLPNIEDLHMENCQFGKLKEIFRERIQVDKITGSFAQGGQTPFSAMAH